MKNEYMYSTYYIGIRRDMYASCEMTIQSYKQRPITEAYSNWM